MQINKVMWILLSCVIYNCHASGINFLPLSPLIWGYCDPAVYNIEPSVIKYLGKRLTCTKMVAPMDYSDPSKGTILVALSRVSAENPSNHKGVIFFNPGGPGADGIGVAPLFGELWSTEDKNDPVGSKFRQLSREYDLVSFSPRGVGSSTQLVCKLPGSFSPPTLPGLGRIIQNYYNDLQELEVKACRTNPLTPYINTDATARDMDLARSLLGEQKISYIGYSYGTWLGTWYAALFPDRVDKMVLDSSMDITTSLPLLYNNFIKGSQYILDNIIAPYAATCCGSFDSSANNLSNILPALSYTMKIVTYNLLMPTLYSQGSADLTVSILLAAKAVNQILENNPSATQQQIDAIIDRHHFNAIEAINTVMVRLAKIQCDTYFKLTQELTKPYSIALSDTSSTYMAIMCNDMNSPTDFNFWARSSDELTTSLNDTVMNYNCTSKWDRPTVTRPDIANISKYSPPILMVQNQFDGITPFEGAIATYRTIGKAANMVVVTKNYDHMVFDRIQNKCADEAVLDYLLSGKLPASRRLICEGISLLESTSKLSEVTVAPQATTVVSLTQIPVGGVRNGNKISAQPTDNNEAKRQKLRDEIRNTMINAELVH